MAFDVMGTLKKTKDALVDLGAEKTQEVLSEVNLLLRLLQDAGYEVSQLEIELGVPPTVTIDLKTGDYHPAVEPRLESLAAARDPGALLHHPDRGGEFANLLGAGGACHGAVQHDGVADRA